MTTGTPSLCPCCGTPVQVVGSEEGTQSYRPVVADEMIEAAAKVLCVWGQGKVRDTTWLDYRERACHALMAAALTFEKGETDDQR